MRPSHKATITVTTGVALSLGGAVLFAIGWEQPGLWRWLVCATALLLVAASLFAFADGWDRYKTIKNSAQIRGSLVWPTMPSLPWSARIELKSQDGELAAVTSAERDGRFTIDQVEDGVWSLQVTSPWIVSAERILRVQRRERLDLGALPVRFNHDKLFVVERLPKVGQLSSYAEDANGTEWAVGFVSKEHRNSRIILNREKGASWGERIVPTIGEAERGEVVSILQDGTIVIATIDAGGTYSADGGLTWRRVSLPKPLNSLSSLIELPDKSIVAGAWQYRGSDSPPGHVLVYPAIDGAPVVSAPLEGRRVSNFFLAPSDRLFLTTSGKTPSVLFSEDYGRTWNPSDLGDTELDYGSLTDIINVDDVFVTALRKLGSGKNLLLRSEDDGLTWKAHSTSLNIAGLHGFAVVGRLLFGVASQGTSKPALLIYSLDQGISWRPLAEMLGAPAPFSSIGKLKVVNGKPVLICLNTVTSIQSDVVWALAGQSPLNKAV